MKQITLFNPLNPKDQNLNSHLLPLFISYRISGEKLIKYRGNSSCDHVRNSHDHSVLHLALILQGEI